MQERDDAEGDDERGQARGFRGQPQRIEQRLQQMRERRFTHPAQAQRGERDAQLAGGQIRIQVRVHVEQQAAAPAVFFRQAHGLGVAQLDQGELGGHEETVEHHQQQRQRKEQEVADHSRPRSTAAKARTALAVARAARAVIGACAAARPVLLSGSSPMGAAGCLNGSESRV
ncbi:hypothetical protein D3C71_1498950 [compost metagenome]